MFSRLLLAASLSAGVFLSVRATAGPVTPPRPKQQEKYGGTRGSHQVFPVTFTEAGTTKTVRRLLSATTYSDFPELFHHGAQVEVSCSDSVAGSAHRSGALFCWVQTRGATITPGIKVAPYGDANGGEYNWGGYLGWINDETEGSPCSGCATNQDGIGACFAVHSGTSKFNTLDPAFFGGAPGDRRPTNRNGYCAGTYSGWPCDNMSDCPGSLACAAGFGLPTGAFLAAVPTSTTVTCTVEAAW